MRSFSKTYTIAARIEEVFAALTEPASIESWSGQAAEFQLKPGGKFVLWDGTVQGLNLDFTEPKQLIQDWKEEQWKNYSKVTFNLSENEDDETEIEVVHENIPETSYLTIIKAWDEAYMKPLTKYLEEAFHS